MIILTGVSGGIGSELIHHLKKFDKILGIYNKKKPKNKIHNVEFFQCDITKKNHLKKLEKKIKFEKSIIFLSLAGIKQDSLLINQSLKAIDQTIDINLKSNILISKIIINQMIFSKWGRVIFFSSTGASRGDVGTSLYSASKTALYGFSKVLSKEYGKYNITSNIIDLGAFNSGMYKKLNNRNKNKILKNLPNSKLGEVKDIASTIKYLINNSFINGSIIKLDGGAD
tara:strand:+ start:39028 stop:39708 length:681 start_codon:yes stop_codon:yes gene_type:complete